MYREINIEAKNYLLRELNEAFDKKYDDKKLLYRCYKEINMLFDKNVLFIIEQLYRYKKEYNDVSFYFEGMINNLLVLYVFGLSNVDPIKYNLDSELYLDDYLSFKILNDPISCFIRSLNKNDSFKFIHLKNKYNPEDDSKYLIIPEYYELENMELIFNSDGLLETYSEYRPYYLMVQIKEKDYLVDSNKAELVNSLSTPDDLKIANVLKPKTIEEYIKVKSLAHSVKLWKDNQDELYKQGKLTTNDLITSVDDIFDYLVKHEVDKDIAIDIIRTLKQHLGNSSYVWNEYVKIMKEHNCDDTFIKILNKLIAVYGRGEAISECLFVLDEDNYLEL